MKANDEKSGIKINADRLLANLHTLKTFTDTPGDGVTRFSYGAQDARTRKYILDRAKAAGCLIRIDALQNIRIGLPGNVAGRPTVIAGSHIDTVRNGGWLDGIFGVCGALEVLESLAEQSAPPRSGAHSGDGGDPAPEQARGGSAAAQTPREAEQTLACNYEMVIFAEEEGSGFGSTMTGSKFIAGIYGDADLDHLTGDDGRSLRTVLESLRAYGANGDTGDTEVYHETDLSAKELEDVIWDFGNIKTMLELHIEQGPVLDRAGLPLGIVDSIFGMRVVEITLTGVGNHAGATPMPERYDALCSAAECILAAERIVREDPDKRTVVTTGKLEVQPNCSNVIPETVKFTIEVRDKDVDKIDGYMDRILEEIRAIAASRQVECEIREHSRSTPLHLTDRLIDSMQERASAQGIPHKVMDSGAVHDACMIAAHVDTGMIFVPSIDGRSHVPEENTNEPDLITGAQFLLDTVLAELTNS